ncbi:MAG TPA: hypothetical protein VEK39_08005 [Solirubrobacterales bacterium]|nr:hypothetical protein [Solirubrobacterales bacterium]
MAALAVVLATLLAASGCGGGSGEGSSDPVDVVSHAGEQTASMPTLRLILSASSGQGSYEARGLIEPHNGRFRVQLDEFSAPTSYAPHAVVGLEGEGFETTFEERVGEPFGDKGQVCWLNLHAPAGSALGTVSVEEGVRVTGAVLESLADEVDSAVLADGDAYNVTLSSSAAQPHNAFHGGEERVWGDRELLGQLDGPIEITLSPEGTVNSIGLELADYQPYGGFGRPESDLIPHVTVEATLAPTDERLRIDRPNCQAME